jgi:electron transfer flavoprotein alpha subunit
MLNIDTKICDLCGTCISVCPANALLLLTDALQVDQKCTQCGACVKVCPFGALSFQKAVPE